MNFNFFSGLFSENLLLPKLISLIFHPVFIIVMMFAAMIFFGSSESSPYLSIAPLPTFLLSLLFVVVLPVMSTAWLLSRKVVSSWEMPTSAERRLPLILMMFFAVLLFVVYRSMGVTGLVAWLPLFGLALVLLVFLVNLFWKISIHMTAMGAFAAGVLTGFPWCEGVYCLFCFGVVVLFSVVTALARLKLKAHNPSQLVIGWIAGFATGLMFYLSVM